ncbi:MAG: DedA family protein [Amaricoccus sp.]|uniref:DedA family protein n=1 Tax=Amaricoccus sp. TaxID=1872485 RepID=UPI0039E44712
MSIVATVEHLVSQLGAPALFVTLTLESLGAPVPGESAVIAASAAASRGELDIRAVAVAAFAGAVLGDNIGFLIGRKLGRRTVVRYGSRFGVTDAAFDRVEAVARRWGPLMVVAARFVVLLRQLNGIVAGTTGMAWPRFLAANALGAALWVGLWCTLAWRLGRDAHAFVPWIWHHLSLAAAVLVPLLVLGLLALRLSGCLHAPR